MGLGRLDEAEAALAALDQRDPEGYLEEAVPMQLGRDRPSADRPQSIDAARKAGLEF